MGRVFSAIGATCRWHPAEIVVERARGKRLDDLTRVHRLYVPGVVLPGGGRPRFGRNCPRFTDRAPARSLIIVLPALIRTRAHVTFGVRSGVDSAAGSVGIDGCTGCERLVAGVQCLDYRTSYMHGTVNLYHLGGVSEA